MPARPVRRPRLRSRRKTCCLYRAPTCPVWATPRMGRILAAWRGFRAAAAYNVFASVMEEGKFGRTIKVSPEASPYPPLLQLGNYSLGGGDFVTAITGDKQFVHIVFPYSPSGVAQRTYYARVGLSQVR